MGQLGKAELSVQPMGIPRREHEAPQALTFRMATDRFLQSLRQALAAVRLEHIDVGQVGNRRFVCHDAGRSNLLIAVKQTEAQRIGDRTLDDLQWYAGRPIASRQKGMDRLGARSPLVGRVAVLAASAVGRHARAWPTRPHTANNSTSNTSVAFGGITPPAPRAP